jgi:ribosomal protein S18 acetylase RimI-like enzyme
MKAPDRPTGAVRVRRYRPDDRPFYERCVTGLQDHLRGLDPFGVVRRPPAYGPRYGALARSMIRRYRGRILIAEIDGRPVGFVSAYVRPRNAMRDLELAPGRHGFVMDLYVAPAVRSRGVGATLLAAAERFLVERGCSRVWLDVFVPNVRAHALYRRLGYADFGVLMTAALARRRSAGPGRALSGRSRRRRARAQ